MTPPAERLTSLDVLRGLTVAGMILVNNAGDWSKVYGPLAHAEWHGWTPTDLIFPFFLFIVGVSITLSFARRAPTTGAIVRRAALLFALGLLLNAFPFAGERPLRVLGVLQRIALCYLAAGLLAARLPWRAQAGVAAGLLVLHTAALRLVPGFDLTKGGDVGSWLDRLLLSGHLHQAKADGYSSFDPEGLFSTLPAVATTLAGVLAGRWLGETARAAHERASGLFFAGLVGALAGLVADAGVPINKSLWTASYVLLSGGLACQALAACWWLVDLQGVRAWTPPFLAFGRNPIVAFWASHALARLLVFGLVWEGGNAKRWLYEAVFARGGSTHLTSVTYAATYVLVWWALMAFMDRRGWYVKV